MDRSLGSLSSTQLTLLFLFGGGDGEFSRELDTDFFLNPDPLSVDVSPDDPLVDSTAAILLELFEKGILNLEQRRHGTFQITPKPSAVGRLTNFYQW